MVGYAENHAPDCYRFINLESRKIIQSRDVIWDEELSHNEYNVEIQETVDESNDEVYDQIIIRPSSEINEIDEEDPTENMESGEATLEKIIPRIDQLQNLMAVNESMGVVSPNSFEKAVREVKWKVAIINELSQNKWKNVTPCHL